jgi:hypothetical protein
MVSHLVLCDTRWLFRDYRLAEYQQHSGRGFRSALLGDQSPPIDIVGQHSFGTG